MDSEQNLAQDMINDQPIRRVAESSRNSRGMQESADPNNLPLMQSVGSQAGGQKFSHSFESDARYFESPMERDLKKKLRVLEETLRMHEQLVTKIYKLSGSRHQHQMQVHSYMENNENDADTINNVLYLSTSTQNRLQMVSIINSSQQISSPPAEINAEGDTEDQPTGIQLAEETSHSNRSAEARGLQISSHSEETPETATESITITPPPTTPMHHENFLKKRWLAAASSSNNNLEQEPPAKKHCGESNSVPSTPIIQNTNSSNNTPTAKRADFSPLLAADAMVSIGPNGTCIPARVYHNINWKSVSKATRKLLMAVFSRTELATHSMSGMPSPAFKGRGKPTKEMLDSRKISDIVYVVERKCNVSETTVRHSITSKCADESKCMRLKMSNETLLSLNKENQLE